MRKSIGMRMCFLVIFLIAVINTFPQNVGIGNSNPKARLDIYGNLKISSTTADSASTLNGTIQYGVNPTEFEGFNGSTWIPLHTLWTRFGSGNANIYRPTGSVGIGWAIPDTWGKFGITSNASTSNLVLRKSGVGDYIKCYDTQDTAYPLLISLDRRGSTSYARISISTDYADQLTIHRNGKIGFGTNDPGGQPGLGSALVEFADNDPLHSDWCLRVASELWYGYPAVLFAKSRGTLTSPLPVTNGHMLGGNVFFGWDGIQFSRSAEMRAEVDGTPGISDMPGRLMWYTTPDGSDQDVERLRITNQGYVGINTQAPSEMLDVNGRIVVEPSSAPSTTTNKLYNLSGTLYWAGSPLGGGGVPTSRTLTFNNTANQTTVTGGTQDLSADRTWTIGLANDAVFPGNAAVTFPVGTTAQRPGTPANGMARYNTTINALEFYQNGTWISTSSTPGTVTSVAAGNGMNFTTITGSGSVTLGTPSNLSGTTSNSVTGTTHTHAITMGSVASGNADPVSGGSVFTALGSYLPLAGGTMTGKINTPASTTTTAALNLPHGAAPTSPVNGDLWTTTAGIYGRINGTTIGPLGTGNGTVTSVAATAPVAGFTITGSPITTSGTFTFALADDLAAIEGIGTTGIAKRTGTSTWTTITDNSANWDAGYTYRLTSASGTAPLTLTLASNGLTGSIAQANTTTSGYLGSTDWNTFNGKESALTFNNGLTRTTNTVTLGGTLNAGTTIDNSTFAFTLGGAAATGALTLGSSTGTQTVNIGTGTGASTVNIATGATNANTINIGTGAVANTLNFGNTGAACSFLFNSGKTTGIAFDLNANSLTTGTGMDISSTSTAGNGSKLINLNRSGANGTAGVTNYGIYSLIANTGTTSTNIAADFKATGGTTNIALRFEGSTSGTLDISPAATTTSYALTLPSSQGAANTYLKNDGTGALTWSTVSGGSLPSGTSAQTLRHDGTNWVANSILTNDGTNVGIGTISTGNKLHVAGNVLISTPSAPSILNIDAHGSTSNIGKIVFTNTSGTGDFQISGDGGDIYWQGGGARNLQMGAYHGMDFIGGRGTTAAIAFTAGTGTSYNSRFLNTTDAYGLIVQGFSTQTHNLQEWRNNAGTGLSAVDENGYLGIGTVTPAEKVEVSNGNVLISNTNNTPGELHFMEGNTSGTNYTSFKATTQAANITYTLPATQGSASTFLQNNGSGVLSWATSSASLPAGTSGQTLRHDGTNWIANSFLYNNGSSIGVNTTSPDANSLIHANISSNAHGKAIFGFKSQSSTATDYMNIGVIGGASGANSSWGYSAGTVGFYNMSNSYFGQGVLGIIDNTNTPSLSTYIFDYHAAVMGKVVDAPSGNYYAGLFDAGGDADLYSLRLIGDFYNQETEGTSSTGTTTFSGYSYTTVASVSITYHTGSSFIINAFYSCGFGSNNSILAIRLTRTGVANALIYSGGMSASTSPRFVNASLNYRETGLTDGTSYTYNLQVYTSNTPTSGTINYSLVPIMIKD
ncbi:MAG: hypothetical protein NTU44_05730 [Bacteroidetes bacterium]|nr:hypothetical protein [Bacteroidota bacterium]